MKKIMIFLSFVLLLGCRSSHIAEKHQNSRNHILNVHDNIVPIPIGDYPLISGNATLYLLAEYLIVLDISPIDHVVHIFDRNSFQYISSAIQRGRGPGEVITASFLETDEQERTFYLSDFGKSCIFSYNIDSLVADPLHRPQIKTNMEQRRFPVAYNNISDTLAIGLLLEAIGNSDFSIELSKINFQTGEMNPFGYVHPKIKKKRVAYAVSPENGLIAESYTHYDLMTIYNLEGEVISNIYGHSWDRSEGNEILFCRYVAFCGDKIITSFSGAPAVKDNQYVFPTKFHVFELNGDYIKTLETQYAIDYFRYDPEKNRILMTLNDEMQFAYLDLDGLI